MQSQPFASDPNDLRTGTETATGDNASNSHSGVVHPDAVISACSFDELIRRLHEGLMQLGSPAENRAVWGAPRILLADRAPRYSPHIERMWQAFEDGMSRKESHK